MEFISYFLIGKLLNPKTGHGEVWKVSSPLSYL
jgi:hypothetical protein